MCVCVLAMMAKSIIKKLIRQVQVTLPAAAAAPAAAVGTFVIDFPGRVGRAGRRAQLATAKRSSIKHLSLPVITIRVDTRYNIIIFFFYQLF